MDKETLRMQMLAGVITESEYKEKLEEAEPGNLMLSNAAKQIYQYIKSNKYDAMLQIDGKVIGANKNAPFTLYSDSKSGKISVRGIGSDQNTVKDTMTKLQNLILGHFDFLEKDGEIQVNFDGMKNASLGSFALRIKPDMLKKGQVTEALNEHYVAGGIVGIGAITQIPSRAKADYEDAFEHFLGQKYEIKEEMEEVKEGGNDWWVRADEELGLDFDGENLEDLVMNADESWQADFAQQVLDIDASDYEDYKNQVSTIYDETNPF
jgi:predicted RNase H-like HicB family nuclease